jgi:hypothetical protein
MAMVSSIVREFQLFGVEADSANVGASISYLRLDITPVQR